MKTYTFFLASFWRFTLSMLLVSMGSILSTSQIFAQDGDFVWAKAMGGTGIDYGTGVSSDSRGNVYTVGYFQGTVDFDPGPGIFNLTSAGSDDVFISKLDSDGKFVWAKSIGGPNEDRGHAVCVDSSGNLYLTGYFYDVVDFDPGLATFNLASAGEWDIFVWKLDSDGNFVWAKRMGGATYDVGLDIAADSAGNAYTVGRFRDTADFDPGTGQYDLTSHGGDDVFVSKLDSSGQFVWAKAMGGSSRDIGESIDVDSLGNVYTIGEFDSIADFDPGLTQYNLTSAGGNDVFISKLDSSGQFVWAKAIGGSSTEGGFAIAVDRAGNVYSIGYFYFTVDFDPDPTEEFNLESPGGMANIFISRLDANGTFVWAGSLGGNASDMGTGIAVDNKGNIYATGYFNGTADFDPGQGIMNLTSMGSYDVFVCKLDNRNNLIWAKAMGGSDVDIGNGIAVDSRGNVFTTGYFNGTADFDPGQGIMNLTSAGDNDIFLSNLAGELFPWTMFLSSLTKSNQNRQILQDRLHVPGR